MTASTVPATTTNVCGGKCGAHPPAPKFFCPPCSSRLPEELRRALAWALDRGNVAEYLRVVLRARGYLAANPAPAEVSRG